MANHTITVVTKTSRSGSNPQTQNSGIDKIQKSTSSLNQFGKKTQKMVSGIKKTNALFSSGKIPTGGAVIALAMAAAQLAEKTVGIYSNFMESKTGEAMRYHNLRQTMNIIARPGSFLKQAIWDYGVVAPMRINRQNEMLNYNRELTGSVIHSKVLGKNY